ncbi:hypothetical protein F5Y14DRAFT_456563 [Nemania sp. NC0429]|nr:hypothetical protein F5Y14DRAFT_456563 [Nemania sp. NC0429]
MPDAVVNKNVSDTPTGLLSRWTGRCTRQLKLWGFNALDSISSQEMFRKGPQLLMKLVFGVAFYICLTSYNWYSAQSYTITFSSAQPYRPDSKVANHAARGNATGGLRMVVFGGGDVATPILSSAEGSGQGHAWTEVMCKKLGCDTYLSFVPTTDTIGGAVISNPLLDAAYRRVASSAVVSGRGDEAVKLDYSWVAEQYPRSLRHDLASQVDTFLSSSRARRAATESLWVFNVGYWDVWYLAALPRRLATEVLDLSVRDLFFQIERLYRAAQDRDSVAFSEPYFYDSSARGSAGVGSGAGSRSRVSQVARAPFRIFLARLFDISLAPGFASARPKPPSPHLSSSQLRNAAFLTKYWDALLETAVDEWLATPDPESWSTADTIDINVVEAVIGRRSLERGDVARGTAGQDDQYGLGTDEFNGGISLPRRKVASYGISLYLKELMIDRQLRNSDLYDQNGLGARPPEDGFLDITMPCALNIAGGGSADDEGGDGSEDANGNGDEDEDEDEDGGRSKNRTIVCQEPDNYLFYTGFTVGRRAIQEIGRRAARRLLDQVEAGSRWRERASMYKDGGRGRNGRLEKFTAQPAEILAREAPDCHEVHVCVALRKTDPRWDGEDPSILFVKVSPDHEVRVTMDGLPRRVVEELDEWVLPGATCWSLDMSIFHKAWSDCFAQLGITITRFKQMVHSEIITIDDRDGPERKVLVLVFTASWREVSPMQLPNARFDRAIWAFDENIKDQSFRLRNRALRQTIKAYVRGQLILNWRSWVRGKRSKVQS